MDSTPRICLVSTDRDPGDSPDLRLAELLAGAGWDVHILACATGARLASAFATVTHLEDIPETPEASLIEWAGEFDRHSLHVLAALEKLHRAKPFDVIQYPEEGARGFRLAQAKQTGSVLESAYLLAKLRGPNGWRRTTEARWLYGPHELVQDFGEQTSFELADGHASLSQYLIAEARRLGWTISAGTAVIPDCPAPPRPAAPVSGPVGEIVFAGKLDKLHGFRVFVRAVQALPANVPVALVGPDWMVEEQLSSRWAIEKLKGRRVTHHQTEDWAEILQFLRERNRLAVVPYLSAADVEFVRTLARNSVPFLVSDFGPAAELVADDEARKHTMFPASVSGLTKALAAYLGEPAERRRGWVERLAAAHNYEAECAAIRGFYERVLLEVRAKRAAHIIPASPRALPRVTVGVTHYNLGAFLPATLASIAAQSYPNLEVVVADDGSNDASSIAVVEEMERKYPQFKFLRGPNVGVCGNRNRCLSAATGELFFPLDADNVAAPEMVERLVSAFLRQPKDVGAVSCFWLGFTTDENLKARRFCGSYRPTGGPRLAVGLWNPYGETSGLFRTEFLRELGGYDDLHPEYMSEDWHLYIKIAARGLKVAVIPKALYFYRIRGDSRYRTGDHGVNHLRVLPDVAAMTFTQPERLEVWNLLASMMHAAEDSAKKLQAKDDEKQALIDRLGARRYRVADGVCAFLQRVASVRHLGGYVSRKGRRVWGRLKRLVSVSGRGRSTEANRC